MSQLSRRALITGAAAALAATSCETPAKRRAKASPAGFDLDRFVDDIKRARADSAGQEAVADVLARAVADPGAVLRVLGEPTKAGIQTLHHDPDVSVFNIVWAPLMVLVPHDHLMWATIGIYTGREDNILWERSGDVIEARTAASLSEKEVFSLPHDAIHSVVNPVERLTGAIHVYGGDLTVPKRSQWDAETLREKPFDMEETRRLFREANERLGISG